jgi:hypothetical protein
MGWNNIHHANDTHNAARLVIFIPNKTLSDKKSE